ncbi:hypothetical protein ABZV34_23975 [Streptomyces sp. NPDC005195]|uniref:hypothetical protein n=1 Tax=Streptomyces sp. NPDC005195 TaxID=3154561 RepID=UPI0033A7D938
MSSNHRDPGLTVRPPVALKAAAQEQLGQRGRETKAFVVACLNALVADPDGFLETLAEHWPAESRRGRPPKENRASASDTSAAGAGTKHQVTAPVPEGWGDHDDAPRALLDEPPSPPDRGPAATRSFADGPAERPAWGDDDALSGLEFLRDSDAE